MEHTLTHLGQLSPPSAHPLLSSPSSLLVTRYSLPFTLLRSRALSLYPLGLFALSFFPVLVTGVSRQGGGSCSRALFRDSARLPGCGVVLDLTKKRES